MKEGDCGKAHRGRREQRHGRQDFVDGSLSEVVPIITVEKPSSLVSNVSPPPSSIDRRYRGFHSRQERVDGADERSLNLILGP